jgi:mRNA interferase RelE/StbE
MKAISYTDEAMDALYKHRGEAKRIMAKIDAYAKTGTGNIKRWGNVTRLRIGGFRAVFEESDTEIIVTAIGPRGSVYE